MSFMKNFSGLLILSKQNKYIRILSNAMFRNSIEATDQENGLNITIDQFKKILTAGKQDKSIKIGILKENLNGDQKLLLTKTQINKLSKATSSLDLSSSHFQLKKIFQKFVKLHDEHKIRTVFCPY